MVTLIQSGCSLIISITIAFVVTYYLSQWKPELEYYQKITKLPTNKNEFTITNNISPNYFNSRGKLYVSLWSQYANLFNISKLEMSLDNINWSQIHLITDAPTIGDSSKYEYLGYIDLNQPRITVCGQISFSLQTLPSNVSKNDVLKSIKGNIWIDSIKTPKDWTLLIIVFTSFLSACYGILSSVLSSY